MNDYCFILPGIGTKMLVFAVTDERSPSLGIWPKLVEALT